MQGKIEIPFGECEKYSNMDSRYQGSMLMIDLVSRLLRMFQEIGDLITINGGVVKNSSVQVLKIPRKLSLKISESPENKTIVLDYRILDNDNTIASILYKACVDKNT